MWTEDILLSYFLGLETSSSTCAAAQTFQVGKVLESYRRWNI